MEIVGELRRTFTNRDEWTAWLMDAKPGELGSLQEEVENYLIEVHEFRDFDNVTWDADIERIYNEVKGE